MYNYHIPEKTKQLLSPEHAAILQHMLDDLCIAYEECDHRREFYLCYFLLNSYRNIIMVWSITSFSLAYDVLSDWQQAFLGAR